MSKILIATLMVAIYRQDCLPAAVLTAYSLDPPTGANISKSNVCSKDNATDVCSNPDKITAKIKFLASALNSRFDSMGKGLKGSVKSMLAKADSITKKIQKKQATDKKPDREVKVKNNTVASPKDEKEARKINFKKTLDISKLNYDNTTINELNNSTQALNDYINKTLDGMNITEKFKDCQKILRTLTTGIVCSIASPNATNYVNLTDDKTQIATFAVDYKAVDDAIKTCADVITVTCLVKNVTLSIANVMNVDVPASGSKTICDNLDTIKAVANGTANITTELEGLFISGFLALSPPLADSISSKATDGLDSLDTVFPNTTNSSTAQAVEGGPFGRRLQTSADEDVVFVGSSNGSNVYSTGQSTSVDTSASGSVGGSSSIQKVLQATVAIGAFMIAFN